MTTESSETKFCQECGAEINEKAEICPECGVRQPETKQEGDSEERAKRARQFLYAGVILGFAALLFLPIIFGPLAAICGLLTLYYGRPLAGVGSSGLGSNCNYHWLDNRDYSLRFNVNRIALMTYTASGGSGYTSNRLETK